VGSKGVFGGVKDAIAIAAPVTERGDKSPIYEASGIDSRLKVVSQIRMLEIYDILIRWHFTSVAPI
jgi:hypothetical protein